MYSKLMIEVLEYMQRLSDDSNDSEDDVCAMPEDSGCVEERARSTTSREILNIWGSLDIQETSALFDASQRSWLGGIQSNPPRTKGE
jgi:hypothetical protein